MFGIKEGVMASNERLDDELENYFRCSRQLLCKYRLGSVVVVIDIDAKVANVLKFVVESCGVDVDVVLVDDPSNALNIVQEMNGNIKAIVVNSRVLEKSSIGNDIMNWLDEDFPAIPVWIDNCTQEERETIKTNWSRAGVLERWHPAVDYADILGLPSESAREMLA